MDGTAHLAAEHVVDELVLLDTGKARKAVRLDLGAEMVPAAGQVLDCDLRTGQRGLDARLQLLRGWHPGFRVPGRSPIQSLTMVTLTDIAAEKVRDFMTAQNTEGEIGLRVGVRGGGCSGFQYALALDEKRDDDHVFEAGGIRVLVDPASLQYVDGSTVDYTE